MLFGFNNLKHSLKGKEDNIQSERNSMQLGNKHSYGLELNLRS